MKKHWAVCTVFVSGTEGSLKDSEWMTAKNGLQVHRISEYRNLLVGWFKFNGTFSTNRLYRV